MAAQIVGSTPADRHRIIASGFAEQVAAVRDWSAPTPVDGWRARDVVAHLVGWFPEFLAAGGVTLPSGPAVADDPAAAWSAQTEAVGRLLDGPSADDTLRHPIVGDHRLADAVDRFYVADVFMHTWDLGMSAGHRPGLDPDFAAQLVDGMSEIDELLRSSGQYGPAVAVPADADPVTRLVGFIGRDPYWRPC